MSQIFDALQRTEAKRSGVHPEKLAAATELLEVAERRAAQAAPEGEFQEDLQCPAIDARLAGKPSANQWTQLKPTLVTEAPHPKLVCVTGEESLAAEKFRFLAVRLRHLQQKRPLKRLLITSSMSEEGKSTVAANLACALARRQQKVLLLEGDLRRPSLAKLFGLGPIPGLSELLQGEPSAAMNICQLQRISLWILPAGDPLRMPLEVMQSRRLSLLMDRLSEWFDWIVIDTPPVLPLGDTSVWMRLADGILLVTRPGKTAKRQLQRGLEAIEQSKLLGALLNGSRDLASDEYYHYYAGQGSAFHARQAG